MVRTEGFQGWGLIFEPVKLPTLETYLAWAADLKQHESIRQKFEDLEDWPKHILVQYTWYMEGRLWETCCLASLLCRLVF